MRFESHGKLYGGKVRQDQISKGGVVKELKCAKGRNGNKINTNY